MDKITTQNMNEYNAHAHEWHRAMTSNAAHLFLEKPAMQSELPKDLAGKNVLCIGVGSGEELAQICMRNPQSVVGIDISNALLKIAGQNFSQIQFMQMDMSELQFADESFDLVYSSLALHYAKDWDRLLLGIHRVLKKNGILLFSTHNPAFWAQFSSAEKSHINARGVVSWEGVTVLPGNITVTYYNVADALVIADAVKHAGFTLEKKFHPQFIPINGDVDAATQDLYLKVKEKNEKTPLFLIFKAHR